MSAFRRAHRHSASATHAGIIIIINVVAMSAVPETTSKPEHSGFSTVSSLDLFKNPPLHSSTKSGQWHMHTPIRTSESEVVEIEIPGNGKYIDLFEMFLHWEVTVTKADGSDLQANPANVLVTPGDNFGQSMWKRVTLSVGGRTTEFTPHYAFRSYFANLVNNTVGMKETYLAGGSGWYQDANLGKHGADLDDAVSIERRRDIAGSRRLSFYSKLNLSSLEQERWLVPNVPLKLQLERNSAEFCLMSV
jgi:hypothetical protein